MPKQIIRGDYVFTPIQNAFNNKFAYWISKKEYTIALYCFTVYSESDLKGQTTPDVLDSYIRYFKSKVENICQAAL